MKFVLQRTSQKINNIQSTPTSFRSRGRHLDAGRRLLHPMEEKHQNWSQSLAKRVNFLCLVVSIKRWLIDCNRAENNGLIDSECSRVNFRWLVEVTSLTWEFIWIPTQLSAVGIKQLSRIGSPRTLWLGTNPTLRTQGILQNKGILQTYLLTINITITLYL